MEIKKFKPVDHYVRCTIYGASGVGKTVFGGTAPNPIFASSEAWLLSIVSTLWYSPDYVDIKTVKDLQDLYKFLKEWKHEYKTLVIDSLTEINEIIKEWIEKKVWRWMQRNDRGELAKQIKGIIRAMKDLPIHIIVICQAKETVDDDWKVIHVKPMLNGKNADEVAYLMDIVGYMYINNKGERIITTAPNDKLVSKDRTGKLVNLWPLVALDFKQWIEAVQELQIPVVHNYSISWKSGKKEDAPALIDPKDKETAGKMFVKFTKEAYPWQDAKTAFAELVHTEFEWKKIDQLTEAEWKQLVEHIKALVEMFESMKSANNTDLQKSE